MAACLIGTLRRGIVYGKRANGFCSMCGRVFKAAVFVFCRHFPRYSFISAPTCVPAAVILLVNPLEITSSLSPVTFKAADSLLYGDVFREFHY